jgi:Ca2+-binding RTX toxin-like protein
MSPNVSRLPHAAVLALALLSGSACVPSGAQFSPATGVLTITGTGGADAFVVSAKADGSIVVNGGGVPISGGVPTVANTVRIVIQGRAGDDQLVIDPQGGALPRARITGGPGTDVLVGGSGDDEFVWGPGDGLDTVEGRAGADKLIFHGSDDAEAIEVAANGARVFFFRSVDNVTTDLDDVETLEILARGGSDTVFVGDLTGTDLTQIRLDLAASAGGGDGQPDTITISGTQGADTVDLAGEGSGIRVDGLQASVRITNQEPAGDRLVLNALAGDDHVDATTPGAGTIQLVLSGGLGIDTLLGSEGADTFQGGDGDDFAFMGPGDDTFVWNPGDDDDTIEGEDDFDTLLFNGANIAEVIEVSANGARARFTRNIAIVTTDLAGVEAIDFLARGGADLIAVRDLTGTDVVEVNRGLAPATGTGDGQVDGILVEGTAADDAVFVQGDASGVSLLGLAAQVNVTGAEDPGDGLTIGTGAGDDVVDASGLATPSLMLTADGGPDHDVLIGGDGGDYLLGGDGDDVLLGGPGLDALDGGAGDNLLIQ